MEWDSVTNLLCFWLWMSPVGMKEMKETWPLCPSEGCLQWEIEDVRI